jgi:hypothetical protein
MGAVHEPGPIVAARDSQPSIADAQQLARDLLGPEGTRLAHVSTAGVVASRLAVLFDPEVAELLVMAATLHDIGYSPRIAHTGFHPLDGGAFLRAEGYPDRLASLVANHSWAILTADDQQAGDLAEQFPREGYADMHSSPDGRIIPAQVRLADIAARHADRGEQVRAQHLRAAMARVGSALLVVADPERSGAGRVMRLDGSMRGRQWIDLRDWRGPGPAAPRPEVAVAFDSWWSAEQVYARALESCHLDGPRDADTRTTALWLAHLRAVADLGRDRYFRRALA